MQPIAGPLRHEQKVARLVPGVPDRRVLGHLLEVERVRRVRDPGRDLPVQALALQHVIVLRQHVEPRAGEHRMLAAAAVEDGLEIARRQHGAGALRDHRLEPVLPGLVRQAGLEPRQRRAGERARVAGIHHQQDVLRRDRVHHVRDGDGRDPLGVAVEVGIHGNPVGAVDLLVQISVPRVVDQQVVLLGHLVA